MFNITNEKVQRYIVKTLRELKEQYGTDQIKIHEEDYNQISNVELKNIFSILHFQINECFSFMNSKIRTNRHYNASPSADLIYIINTIKKLMANLKDSKYKFKIDDYYDVTLNGCKSFLNQSGGSTIPPEFEEIDLIEISPIFHLGESITIQRSNMAISFTTEEIGKGSYATVHKYLDTNYNRFIAIKTALPNVGPEELSRLKREFDVLKTLNSPYVVEVYNYDEENNQYTMEYIRYTLEEYIKTNNKLSINQRIKLVMQILNAFIYIHKKECLHRDISYQNILVKDYDGIPIIKVSDFGLVKVKDSNLTRKGTEFKGSLNDPRLSEIGFDRYEVRYEIYALTRLINFVLTGRTTIANYSSTNVSNFISRGMDPDIEKRYSNVEEMAREFNKIKNEL
ncbi:serine/threonine-protein kinase [Peribacillus butanolivorans]